MRRGSTTPTAEGRVRCTFHGAKTRRTRGGGRCAAGLACDGGAVRRLWVFCHRDRCTRGRRRREAMMPVWPRGWDEGQRLGRGGQGRRAMAPARGSNIEATRPSTGLCPWPARSRGEKEGRPEGDDRSEGGDGPEGGRPTEAPRSHWGEGGHRSRRVRGSPARNGTGASTGAWSLYRGLAAVVGEPPTHGRPCPRKTTLSPHPRALPIIGLAGPPPFRPQPTRPRPRHSWHRHEPPLGAANASFNLPKGPVGPEKK